MNKSRSVFFVALLMIAATFIEGRIFAQTAIERLKSEYPAVMEQYGKKLQDLKTHYIFVVDVSGTMDEYKDEVVVPGVKNFIETLPEGDYASIIAFGGKAQVMCTPLKLNSDNRKKLVEELINSYPNDPQDKKNKIRISLETGKTYLDKAVEQLLEVVEKDNKNNEIGCDICFAVFFSDLCDETTREWNYKDRVSKLKDKPFGVVATALRATNEDQKQKGIRRMENTFEGFSYSSNVKDVFGEKLEAFKHDIYVSALKKTVPEELNKAFEGLQLTSKLGVDKKIKLHANIDKNTPAFIRGIVIDTAILVDQSPEITTVKFASKARIPRFKKSCRLGEVVFAEKGKLFHHNLYLTSFAKFHLDTPEPKTDKEPCFVCDLENLGIADAIYSEANLEAKAEWVIGWPFWLFCVSALCLLVFLILLVKNTLIPGRIRNKKFLCKENLNNRNYEHTADGQRKFIVGKAAACGENDWTIPNSNFVMSVRYKNGGPFNWIIKRRIILNIDEGQDAVMSQSIKEKSFNLSSANILEGSVTVEHQGVSYEFDLIDEK